MSWSNGRNVGDLIARGPMVGSDLGLLDEFTFPGSSLWRGSEPSGQGNKFALMLLNTGDSLPSNKSRNALATIARILSLSTLDTDVIGWYRSTHVIGIIVTEIGPAEKTAVLTTLLDRVISVLRTS